MWLPRLSSLVGECGSGSRTVQQEHRYRARPSFTRGVILIASSTPSRHLVGEHAYGELFSVETRHAGRRGCAPVAEGSRLPRHSCFSTPERRGAYVAGMAAAIRLAGQ